MALLTRPKFYYGYTVNSNNQSIDLNEGSGEISGTLAIGDYSYTDYAVQLEEVLNSIGTLEYTVTTNRVDRSITIAANGNFDLLISTGTNVSTSTYGTAGFTGADLTGQASYTGAATGVEYKPQFFLKSYLPVENNKARIASNRADSGSGVAQVVSFGDTANVEMNITFITNIDQGANSDAIETNLSGEAEANAFMDFITDIKNIEFMPNREDPNSFLKLQLLKTRQSGDGTDYKLKELLPRLPGYYETGLLTFRSLS